MNFEKMHGTKENLTKEGSGNNFGIMAFFLALGFMLIVLLPLASASRIIGFEQLQFGEDLSINASTLNILTSNTSRMYFTNAGLVGIGTSAPQQKLTLGNESNLSIEMSIPTGTSGVARNQTGSTLASGTFYYKITALDGAGGETAVTPEISVTLAVPANNASNITWSSVTGAVSYRVYNASSSGGQASFFTVTDTNFTHSGQAFSGESTSPSVTTAYVAKVSAVGDSWLLGGSFGIGKSSPNYKLDVAGQINASAVNVTGTVQAITFIGDGSKLTGISTGQIWNSTGTNVYLNDSTAKVGIGDSSPYNELVVIGSVGVSGSLNATSINTTGSAYFATSSGNVGIGKTSPNFKLDVAGQINVSGVHIDGDLNVTGSTYFVKLPFPIIFPEASMFVKDCVPKYVAPVTFKSPSICTPEEFICPATSNLKLGLVFPIPTFPA